MLIYKLYFELDFENIEDRRIIINSFYSAYMNIEMNRYYKRQNVLKNKVETYLFFFLYVYIYDSNQ